MYELYSIADCTLELKSFSVVWIRQLLEMSSITVQLSSWKLVPNRIFFSGKLPFATIKPVE